VLAFGRADAGADGGRVRVALNLAGAPRTVPAEGRVLVATGLDRAGERVAGELRLRAHEGVVLALPATGPGPA
jgi:hypothetical protein